MKTTKALAVLADHDADDQIMILDTVRAFLGQVSDLAARADEALQSPSDMSARRAMAAAADVVIDQTSQGSVHVCVFLYYSHSCCCRCR